MDKEDKQTIKRAVKEEWRIGDRTRLKRLLEKNLEQYRENKTLEGCLLAEQEHTLMLENENRLLGERCNQLLKDKGELTDQIADLKETNAILYESAAIKQKDMEYKVSVIEQRNKRIEELEQENAGLKAGRQWHYVKDGNPDNDNDILCQIAKDYVEVGYYHIKEKQYFTMDGQPINVIAWQEIIFPEDL